MPADSAAPAGLYSNRLVLFFTRGVSLRIWDECGLFSREVALYRKLQEKGVRVAFITYGDESDLCYCDHLPGIAICCNRWRLPKRMYARLLPWLHRDLLRHADLIKTNQMEGAEVALRAARRFRKPLIARCGYMWSKNLRLEQGEGSSALRHALMVERRVFPAAAAVAVTSEEMRESLLERFPDCRERLRLIPNYVDTELFRPMQRPHPATLPRLCYVGRLAPEKNLSNLIEAVRGLDVELDIVGKGPCRDALQAQAASLPQVKFHGVLSNDRLPAFFAQGDLFVFPSLYEGHPKTPIEAMACGLPVIGTDVAGIRELVDHGRTGLLCGKDVPSLRQAIRSLVLNPERRARMGTAARKDVVERFSLERIVSMELELYRSLRESRG